MMHERKIHNRWRDHNTVVAQRLQQGDRESALETLRRQGYQRFEVTVHILRGGTEEGELKKLVRCTDPVLRDFMLGW